VPLPYSDDRGLALAVSESAPRRRTGSVEQLEESPRHDDIALDEKIESVPPEVGRTATCPAFDLEDADGFDPGGPSGV
jgi:hypothetical protein